MFWKKIINITLILFYNFKVSTIKIKYEITIISYIIVFYSIERALFNNLKIIKFSIVYIIFYIVVKYNSLVLYFI